MSAIPCEVTLQLRPQRRVELIDVAKRLREEAGDLLDRHARALYCSYHTTAGYFDQSWCKRLQSSGDRLNDFLGLFQRLYPAGANYDHDKMYLRSELTDEQKVNEPLNADSHLTFISSGLRNCVTYVHKPGDPVFFVDLDGVYGDQRRTRQTTVVGFDQELPVESVELEVAVSAHPIDSVNLRAEDTGLFEELEALRARHSVEKGRIDISLVETEQHAGLTVNEYETLLMKRDVAEVLRDPLRFMAEKGKHALRDPLAIPNKTLSYAQYDLVQVVNEVMDVLGVSESFIERLLAKVMAVPASRFFRLRRSVSLLITDRDGGASIQQGTYQSPVLLQWRKAEGRTRRLRATMTRFA